LPHDLFFLRGCRIQWWYLTGHLFDESGREFGYELTFFAAGVQQREYRSQFGVDFIYISHFAVTDVHGNRFSHAADADTGAYGFAGADEARLHVRVGNASLSGDMEAMHIKAGSGDESLELTLAPIKPAVRHGQKGYSRKSGSSPLIASRYFSFTDLHTTGRLITGGAQFNVSGKSWFDREISSRGLSGDEAGWDWFAIQLDDHRELMIYEIRNKDGTTGPYSSGTVVYRDGTSRHLSKDDFSIRVLDHYTSDRTKARYPSRWDVAVPSEDLKLMVTPLVKDQEFTGAGALRKDYWEGTCRVEGPVRGRAYVEMTGYEK
jgi:predicted secreted hydrolase